jgi:hypothetical protein
VGTKAVLEKLEAQKHAGEKDQLVKELKALLLCTPITRRRARHYIEKAIVFIEKQ